MKKLIGKNSFLDKKLSEDPVLPILCRDRNMVLAAMSLGNCCLQMVDKCDDERGETGTSLVEINEEVRLCLTKR